MREIIYEWITIKVKISALIFIIANCRLLNNIERADIY